jgi:hypothetical protein
MLLCERFEGVSNLKQHPKTKQGGKVTVNQVSTKQTKTKTDVEHSVPQFQLPYPGDTAHIVSNQALDFCAQKMGLGDRNTVAARLQQGDENACQYYRYSIAKQVAESLAALDKNLKAAYVADYDATPQDLCFNQGNQMPLIHMIIWVERKTKALNSLVEGLDRALAQRYADVVGLPRLAHLLDVQVVNDEDVHGRIGYGAMLSSIYNRPIQIWER